MKSFLLALALMIAAAPAYACKYIPLGYGKTLNAEQQAELARDKGALEKLRWLSDAQCSEGGKPIITTCDHDMGPCDKLPAEERAKFVYSKDGVRYMQTPEQAAENGRRMEQLYDKWK